METDGELRELQRQADRAEAAPWVDYPRTPTWYFPAAAAWCAALTLCGAGVPSRPALSAVGFLVLLVLEGAFLGWYRRYRRTMPKAWGSAPLEFRSPMRWFFTAVVVVLVAVVAAVLLAGAIVGAGAAFVLVVVGLAVYERAYADAARRVRERLA